VQGPHGGGGSIGSRLILSVLISVIVCLRQKEKGRGDIKASSLLLAPIPSVFFLVGLLCKGFTSMLFLFTATLTILALTSLDQVDSSAYDKIVTHSRIRAKKEG